MKLVGKVSWFGSPDDTGVTPDEGLAFIYEVDDAPHLFLDEQPYGTTGLARRLNPDVHYIATRWDYDQTSKDKLLDMRVLVRAPITGKQFLAYPADWGPHEDTDRIADISPGLMDDLGIDTDDEVEVTWSEKGGQVVISSGHSLHVRGASGIIDEVDEARRVVPEIVRELAKLGINGIEFHDDTSVTQSENLETIVDFHNSQTRDLDVSVHFNAYIPTEAGRGTECLYLTQLELAESVAVWISDVSGLIDRGAHERTDLYFLKHTDKPAVLIEVCFVDSTEDCNRYDESFNAICEAIARSIKDWL